MSQLQELRDQLAVIQNKIDRFMGMPEDLFNLGTVILFDSSSSNKWYLKKVGEESWVKMPSTGTKELASWILEFEGLGVYFEVYELKVQNTPFYTFEPQE